MKPKKKVECLHHVNTDCTCNRPALTEADRIARERAEKVNNHFVKFHGTMGEFRKGIFRKL